MVSILLFAIAAAVGADPQSILAQVKEASGGAAWIASARLTPR